MIDPLLVAFSVLLLVVGSAHAQVSAPNCTDPTDAWTLNSLGQGPCLVAAYLISVCSNGFFSMPALLPQHSYIGPDGQPADDADICKCNSVAYSLVSACALCQGETWIAYPLWTTNCTTVAPPGTFPDPIPAGTRVPGWAYLDPTVSETWDETAAQAAGDSPEVTGTATIVPSLTSQSTITPGSTPTSSSSSSSSSKGSSNGGAIAGGVVGGILGAALIGGIVAWFTIRRKRARSRPSGAYMGHQGGNELGYPLTSETPKLYDPSDPSTYPTQAPSPTIHTSNTAQFPGSDSDLQSHRQVYTGLPEV